MAQDYLANNILSKSNFDSIKSEISDLAAGYVVKLIEDIAAYVCDDIEVEEIELTSSYTLSQEISQRITGIPSAYSAIDGDSDALVAFAEQYSHMGITELNAVAKEILLDFLNLHNGLFIVQLSKNNVCELSLSVPKQNGFFKLTSPVNGSVLCIPVKFSFGTVKFLFCKLEA